MKLRSSGHWTAATTRRSMCGKRCSTTSRGWILMYTYLPAVPGRRLADAGHRWDACHACTWRGPRGRVLRALLRRASSGGAMASGQASSLRPTSSTSGTLRHHSAIRRAWAAEALSLFYPPHEHSERIRIDGRPLAREIFAKYFWDTSDRLQAANFRLPTYFRFLTLVAFNVFLNEKVTAFSFIATVGQTTTTTTKVDVAVIEVGLGGRTDATNVVHPVVCGISSLGLDHQHVLGDTLAEIAYEKAGIFKARQQHHSRRSAYAQKQTAHQYVVCSLILSRLAYLRAQYPKSRRP